MITGLLEAFLTRLVLTFANPLSFIPPEAFISVWHFNMQVTQQLSIGTPGERCLPLPASQANGSVHTTSHGPKKSWVTGLNCFEATTMCPQSYTIQSRLKTTLCRPLHALHVPREKEMDAHIALFPAFGKEVLQL